jgi:hypothetical protein
MASFQAADAEQHWSSSLTCPYVFLLRYLSTEMKQEAFRVLVIFAGWGVDRVEQTAGRTTGHERLVLTWALNIGPMG